MFISPILFTVSLAIAADVGEAQSHDWPQWRGANRDGVSKETGLLKKWPESGPPVAWTAKGLGGSYCTPSVAAGRVFGMGYVNDKEVIWALNEKDGSKLWEKEVAAKAGKFGHNTGSRSTPTVDGNLVYALGINGDLVCVKADTGDRVWAKSLPADFGGKMMSGWGWSESALIDGDRLICSPGNDKAAIVCLNKKNGETLWKSEIPNCGGAGYSSPVKAKLGNIEMYITLLGKSAGAVAVNAKDGKLLWRYAKVGNGTANIPTVIVRGDTVFCSSGYGTGAAVLKMSPEGKDGVKIDEVVFHPGKTLQNHHGGMLLIGDHVYLGHAHNNGFPTCVEFKTGKIVWQEDRGPGTGSAAFSAADGMLYVRYENGLMALIEANPKEYNLVSTFRIPNHSGLKSWPHPVIANGKLFIRDQEQMICFDVKAK
jgi:outer membrane protein assembly factor BamB